MGVVATLEFLQRSKDFPIPPFCVVFGTESFLRAEAVAKLRSLILSDEDSEFSFSRFDGNTATFRDVLQETCTMVMFGVGKRLVLVEQADNFISQNKENLIDYIDEPSKSGVLVLQLGTFPSNLTLYKKASSHGLILDCKPPSRKETIAWLVQRSTKKCGLNITRDDAETFIELIGDDLGALDQELHRLALLSPPNGQIDANFIQNNVGGWRQKKVWDLVDATLDGRTSDALQQLEKLLEAGEVPIAILAQMAATIRKLSAATQIFLEAESLSPKMEVGAALDRVGVKPFVKAKYAEQLKRVGSIRGKRLSELLLQTDYELKGGSKSDPRHILERFIVQISSAELRRADLLVPKRS